MAVAVILIALGVLGPLVALLAVPAPRRPDVTVGAVTAGALVAAAGVVFALVVDGESLDAADAPVLAEMVAVRAPGLTAWSEGLAVFGGTLFTGGLAVLCAVVLALRGRPRRALVWAAAVVVGAVTIRLLKESVERARPPLATRVTEETSASLPSGHALMAAVGLGLTAAAVVALGRGPARWLAVVAAVVLAGAIGISRAYLGVHWTTDVLAGWLLGTAIVVVAATVARMVEPSASGGGDGSDIRPRPDPPVPPSVDT